MKPVTELKWQLIGAAGKIVVDLLFGSTRIHAVVHRDTRPLIASRRCIFALWHSRILLFSYLYRGCHGVAMVSQSEDGEIIARILQRQGQKTVRGSTTRGGLRALARMIKMMQNGAGPGIIIPDGPQGPRFRVQPGIIALAKKTGLPIVPITYSARRMKIFASWDRFVLPWPFTACRAVYGRSLRVPAGCSRQEEERRRVRLEEELCRITRAADRYFGHAVT